jgi:hypothetical protein
VLAIPSNLEYIHIVQGQDSNEGANQMIVTTKEQTVEEKFPTVDESTEEVKRLIGWMGYIAEWEYSPAEKEKLLDAAHKFISVAQPIASKYVD